MIRITWFRESDRKERVNFTMQIGEDMVATSRIFAELCKTLEAEKDGLKEKILGPNRHESERGGES